MSDRRPEMWMPCEHGMLHEHFWNYPPGKGEQCSGGRWAESADLLAVVRRGVESGTIKGEVVEWCQQHRSPMLTVTTCDWGHNKHWVKTPCKPVQVLVIPVSDGGSET